METIQVLITHDLAEPLLDQLRAVSPRLHVVQQTCRSAAEVAEALAAHPDVEVLYGFRLPPDLLDLAPRLRWLQLDSAGNDHLLDHAIMHSDVAITNASGIHATPIAEYVFASMLAHRWQVRRWIRSQARKEWPPSRFRLYFKPELRDSTLGILGYGSIGREVGRLGRAFRMQVLALRRSAARVERGHSEADTGDPQGVIPDRFYPPEALHDMLAECDYVVLALPSTPATYHFIGEAELRAMKPTAYLINIARGAIVDEAALVRALREGWIAGAGLDVFEKEPLPAESPLWNLENVLMSPHVAGDTPCYDERAVALFAENLARYLAGQPLLNLVDKAKGY
jgi:phosphoglycerate dehydrogenase-like enzyme